MATIATTTNASPFLYPGQSLLTRHPSAGINNYICLVKASTADNYQFYRSQDKGATWAALGSAVVRTNLVDVGQIFQDGWGWLFWAYRTNESSQDRIYLKRLNTNDGTFTPSAELLIGSAGNGGTPGSYYSGIDVKSVYLTSTGYHYVAVAVGTNIGATQGVTMMGSLINPSGAATSAPAIVAGTNQWLHAGTAGRVGPSMDLEHNGDGYTSSTPNLWVAYGRTHLKLVKIPWTGYGWTGSPGETTIYSSVGSRDQMRGMWDGNRFYMVSPDPTNTSQVMLFERNRSNSTTLTHRTAVHTTGVVRNCTAAVDPSNGNVRVWAVGTSTAVLYQTVWTRLSDSWSAWASTGLSAILGTNADNYGAKRSSTADSRWGLYTAASGSPNTLTYTPISLAYAPDTPTWASPTSGAAADVALPLPLVWNFTDLDPGDTQSAYAVSKQIGAGSLTYWRASDSTWQASEVKNTSGTSSITVPASWATHTDAVHTFKVKVWDAADTASGYSAGLMVVPSTPVTPSITAPTASQVLGTGTVAVTWTAAEQTARRLRLVAALASDLFGRTVSNGWGSADYGGAWTATGGAAADYSVSSGTGKIALNTVNVVREVKLGSVSSIDFDLTVGPITVPAVPTGAPVDFEIMGRYVDANNFVSARLFFTTGNAVTINLRQLVAGVETLTAFPGVAGLTSASSIMMRFQAAGGTLQMRAWPSAAAEPPTWALTFATTMQSAGPIAIRGVLETGNTNTLPYTVVVDNLRVGGLQAYDSGWVTTTETAFTIPYALTDATAWLVGLTTSNLEGLAATEQWDHFTVSFIPPMTPTVNLTPIPAAGVIRAAITNPTPGGGAPAVATQDLYRRTVGDTSTGIRVATGLANAAVYDDWRAVGSVNYEYRVWTQGTTGTSVFGAWTT